MPDLADGVIMRAMLKSMYTRTMAGVVDFMDGTVLSMAALDGVALDGAACMLV